MSRVCDDPTRLSLPLTPGRQMAHRMVLCRGFVQRFGDIATYMVPGTCTMIRVARPGNLGRHALWFNGGRRVHHPRTKDTPALPRQSARVETQKLLWCYCVVSSIKVQIWTERGQSLSASISANHRRVDATSALNITTCSQPFRISSFFLLQEQQTIISPHACATHSAYGSTSPHDEDPANSSPPPRR